MTQVYIRVLFSRNNIAYIWLSLWTHISICNMYVMLLCGVFADLRSLDPPAPLCSFSPGTGVRNITALGNLISWQKVDYDFNYHQMEFPCNINVLVASEGRSLLPVRTKGL